MTELIPLKKDIIFKTKIGEITSIDVEHDYKVKNDVVEGKLTLKGTYKMTEASLLEEDYYYEIPFSIAIGENIIIDSINVDISDFKYEIDKDILRVNTELEFTCEKEPVMEDITNDFNDLENFFTEEIKEEPIIEKESIIINENKNITLNEENNDIDAYTALDNITNNIINNEEVYNTYKVYIVREGDTVDTICAKFNIRHDIFKEYNSFDINIGDKVIIPFINE